MQQQHITGGETADQAMQYRGRVSAETIQPAPCPGHVAKVRLRHQRIQQRTAQPSGRAKECRPTAGERMNDGLRLLDLTSQCEWATASESARVPVAVVLHAVSAADDIAHDLRVGGGTLANAEETRLGGVLVQTGPAPSASLQDPAHHRT